MEIEETERQEEWVVRHSAWYDSFVERFPLKEWSLQNPNSNIKFEEYCNDLVAISPVVDTGNLQSGNPEWYKARGEAVTASSLGKMIPLSWCGNVVEIMLHMWNPDEYEKPILLEDRFPFYANWKRELAMYVLDRLKLAKAPFTGNFHTFRGTVHEDSVDYKFRLYLAEKNFPDWSKMDKTQKHEATKCLGIEEVMMVYRLVAPEESMHRGFSPDGLVMVRDMDTGLRKVQSILEYKTKVGTPGDIFPDFGYLLQVGYQMHIAQAHGYLAYYLLTENDVRQVHGQYVQTRQKFRDEEGNLLTDETSKADPDYKFAEYPEFTDAELENYIKKHFVKKPNMMQGNFVVFELDYNDPLIRSYTDAVGHYSGYIQSVVGGMKNIGQAIFETEFTQEEKEDMFMQSFRLPDHYFTRTDWNDQIIRYEDPCSGKFIETKMSLIEMARLIKRVSKHLKTNCMKKVYHGSLFSHGL